MKKIAEKIKKSRKASAEKPVPLPDPPCPHWKECGGCPIIKYDYKSQLSMKRKKVYDAFLKLDFPAKDLDRILKPTRSAPLTLGYRNKAKWILDQNEKGEIRMGIYSPGTHRVVDIPRCSVHAPAINEVSSFIKTQLRENSVPCGSLRESTAVLRYIIVRYSFREKKLIVVFVTSASRVFGLDQVVTKLDAQFGDRIVAVVQNINADSGNVLLGEATKYLAKKGELSETLGSYRIPVGPLSFLQVNSSQASYLYKRVREILGDGPYQTGLDLYSGVGVFAMHMASTTKKILAVEEVGPAALEGMTAYRRSRINNILQLCGDSLDGLATCYNEWGAPDWVILNPPRKGCDERVIAAIGSRPPSKLIYVSCNPNTLARDLAMLMNGCPDFKLKSLEPVDMFPQTDHVETIAYLENKFAGNKPVAQN